MEKIGGHAGVHGGTCRSGLLLELDESSRARVMRALVDRATRGGTGWVPPAPAAGRDVAETLEFVRAAGFSGYAEPRKIDRILDRGMRAFLRRDYAAANAIFGAVLAPIGEGEINLGQDELVQEVLTADLDVCGAQYAVSAYVLSPPDERAHSVREALHMAESVWYPGTPLLDMERVAMEPIPGIDDFLEPWRRLVAKEVASEGRGAWCGPKSWLREVADRMDGTRGLEAIARSSKDVEDLRAWCARLVRDGDWRGALAAFEEAGALVAGSTYERAGFLDGAALAAKALGRRDLPKRLEQAWRCDATLLRLCRWLGLARGRGALRKRARTAFEGCPRQHKRQRAFLFVLVGDLPSAAKLLAAAPGLGWSSWEHPGHFVFPLFQSLLAGTALDAVTSRVHLRGWDLDEFEESHAVFGDENVAAGRDRPAFDRVEPGELLDRAGVNGHVEDAAERDVLTRGMRKAAERRLAGVTEHKRRRYYGHAAELVAAVHACDPSPKTSRWIATLRAEYSRYPALRREFDRHLSDGRLNA